MGLHIPGYGDFRRCMKKMSWSDWAILVVLTVAPTVAGIVLACVFEERNTSKPLHKPTWAPTEWLFGLISVGLYLFIGFASYLLWKASHFVSAETTAIWIMYALQLGLSWSWLPLVYRCGFLAGGLIAITACWALVIACVLTSFAYSKLVSFMFMPYLVWISYIVAVNYNIVLLNGAVDSRTF
uniref:Translocator protein n=1 Tax=Plectus sambesii TaxID=2011161 RepID=A0A914W0J0_9BILA